MKTVGVVLRKYTDRSEIGEYGFNVKLLRYLRKYPIKVIGIPVEYDMDVDLEIVKAIIADCDGIILPGGKKGTDLNYDIVKYLYEIDKPTLGICLGMQQMSKAFSKKNNVKVDGHRCGSDYTHKVLINEGSLLYKILGKTDIRVNSLHSYMIPRSLSYFPFEAVAKSEDGVIEAIEDKNKRFFVGVQWHPEMHDDVYSKKLFDYFVSMF